MVTNQRSASEQAGLETGGSLAGLRILVVDDGPDNQALFELHLRSRGADVTLANDGLEGCDLASSAAAAGTPYDVILMDMQMPVMTGYEATKVLREAGYDRPIVALTGHSHQSGRDKCIAAGCDDYVMKPVLPEDLARAVLRHSKLSG